MTDVVIAGAGELPSRPEAAASSMAMHAAAIDLALRDAGLPLSDVDGLITAGSRVDSMLMHASALASYLGIRPAYARTMGLGGASHCAGVADAVMAVRAGRARRVLVASADNLKSAMSSAETVKHLSAEGAAHAGFEQPYGSTLPALYALRASAHMATYGTTRDQLAAAAVTMREHAGRHPHAFLQKPLTVQDVLAARPIAEPLHLLDCCPVSDGGGAVLVTRADDAEITAGRAVRVTAAGDRICGEHLSFVADPTTSGVRPLAESLFAAAGITADGLDAAFLYDPFTIAVVMLVEDFGFCAPGEGGPFVASGALGLTGRLPTNTHGGLLSHGHPGKPGGMSHLVEAIAQLRGEAGPRQVAGARTALVHGCGGILATHSALILEAS